MSERVAMNLLNGMVQAINHHDLSTLISLFHPDYQSIQPVHPERSFQGRDRVAENWAWVFDHFDDFEAALLDFSVREATVWTEWDWRGTDPAGDEIRVRGVMILSIEEEVFRRGRLYMEPLR